MSTDLYIVQAIDTLTSALSGHDGCRYQSPPQNEQQARELIRLLLPGHEEPVGSGPWRCPLAGGTRQIELQSSAGSE